jgi:hypothetical protein
MAEASLGVRPGLSTRKILHPEKMRRDKVVPSDVRKDRRFVDIDVPLDRHENEHYALS